jgi:uncharacterized protein (DUF433 family)
MLAYLQNKEESFTQTPIHYPTLFRNALFRAISVATQRIITRDIVIDLV